MKKILSILLAATLVLSVGCSSSQTGSYEPVFNERFELVEKPAYTSEAKESISPKTLEVVDTILSQCVEVYNLVENVEEPQNPYFASLYTAYYFPTYTEELNSAVLPIYTKKAEGGELNSKQQYFLDTYEEIVEIEYQIQTIVAEAATKELEALGEDATEEDLT